MPQIRDALAIAASGDTFGVQPGRLTLHVDDLPIPLSTGLVGTLELQYVGLQPPMLLEHRNRLRISLP